MTHSSISPVRPLATLGAVVCALCVMWCHASPVHAQQSASSPLTNLPALTTFALISDASPQLHVLLEQRAIVAHHKDLHAMCNDARKRQGKRHWVFPTIQSLSKIVTHNGVVLVKANPEQSIDATARIVPTLSLNTVGAKLRISF